MSDPKKDLFNLAMSDKAQPLMYAVKKHIEDNVAPIMEEFYALEEGKEDRWSWHPRQLELLDGAKAKAKELTELALKTINACDMSGKDRLIDLAKYLISRQN